MISLLLLYVYNECFVGGPTVLMGTLLTYQACMTFENWSFHVPYLAALHSKARRRSIYHLRSLIVCLGD